MTQIKNQILIQSQPFVLANTPPGGGGGRSGSRKDHPPETAGVHVLDATSPLRRTTDKILKTNKINVNLKNSKIMKKLLLSFVMLVTLVIVAGSAKAQDKRRPYQGGTYEYVVKGILANGGGTATITYSGSGATFSDYGSLSIPANSATDLTFKTKYSETATSGKIKVEITENGCSNFIEMQINPVALPAFAVSIATTTNSPYCQTTTATPALETPASKDQTNTIVYQVVPHVSNVLNGSTFTYTYTIDLSETGLDSYIINYTSGSGNNGSCTTSSSAAFTVSGSRTSTETVAGTVDLPADVFTITFNTTTGKAATTVPGAINASSLTVPDVSFTKAGTNDSAKPVTVKGLPTIGSFE